MRFIFLVCLIFLTGCQINEKRINPNLTSGILVTFINGEKYYYKGADRWRLDGGGLFRDCEFIQIKNGKHGFPRILKSSVVTIDFVNDANVYGMKPTTVRLEDKPK
mgnify:FL=1